MDANRKEIFDLTAKKVVCESSVSASEREKTELHAELASKISELSSKELEICSMQSTIQELTAEVTKLRSVQDKVKELDAGVTKLQASIKAQEHTSGTEIAKLEEELADKTSMLTSTELEVDLLKSTNEDLVSRISDLRSSIETLKQERDASTEAFESQTAQLQSMVDGLNQERDASTATFEREKLQLSNKLSSKTSELQSKCREMTRAKEESRAKVAKLEVSKKALEQSTGTRILALERIKEELEAQVTEQLCRKESQEQDIGTMSAKIKSRELQLESLEKVKTELQAQIVQLQGCYRSLEQNFNTKEAQIERLKTELKAEATEHKKAREQAVVTMETEFRSREVKILSLENSSGALEEKVLQFQSIHRMLEQDLDAAVARLAGSDARASALVDVRDKLLADAEVLHKELASSKGRNLTMESEALHKENLLTSLKGENSALESKVLHLTELVAEQQSSLQTANDQASCLATRKAAFEEACSRLEAKLEGEIQTNKSQEAVLASYRSKLDSGEQLNDSLKQRIASFSEQDQMVKEVTRTNQLLQSEQMKLCKRLSVFEKREEHLYSRCEELEAALASEQANSCQLMLALASKRPITPQPIANKNTSTTTPFPIQDGDTSHFQCQDNAQGKSESGMELETEVDAKARMKELKRRNKQALPHLKSSYPIEMQVKPETPTNSDERLKHGFSKVSSREQSSQVIIVTPATQEVSAVSTRTRSGGIREGAYSQSCTTKASPDATPTIQTPADYRKKQRQTVSSSLNLREFLDEDQVPNSTTFEITLSPPKATMPKRLQENRLRRKLKEEDSDAVHRKTVLKKPAVGNPHKLQGSSAGLGKKRVLRSRTHK